MFKNIFKKFEEDEEIFETVDPVVEQRRKEKFSSPLIYDDEFKETKDEKKVEKTPTNNVVNKPKVVKETKTDLQPIKKGYEVTEVISPMFGKTGSKTEKPKKPVAKKNKKRNTNDSLVQVISPYFGNFEEKEEEESEALITKIFEDEDDNKTTSPLTVEDNLRNIAKIVEDEQNELKIIEEKTGEFKLDFNTNNVEKQNSLIDEIDDDMSLDELMSLYEKKFKD